MDFKLRSGSKATVSIGLDELLLSEFQEQVPALDFPEGRHPCYGAGFRSREALSMLRSEVIYFTSTSEDKNF